MTGDVMRVGERLLVDWDDVSVDVEPWLTFNGRQARTLTLAKVDPDGDFSSDYEDLFFTRVGALQTGAEGRTDERRRGHRQVDTLMQRLLGRRARRFGARAARWPARRAALIRSRQPREDHSGTPATNYRLASVTKQFTAAAILLLNEAGKLQLDDPMRKWLPELPEATQPVTIRHLLTHTGGLIDYEDFVPDDAPQVHDADVLRLLDEAEPHLLRGRLELPLQQQRLCAALADRRARFRPALRRLPARSHLRAARHARHRRVRRRRVDRCGARLRLQRQRGNAWTRTDQSSTSAVLGDGGIYSSIDDLAKWDAALYDDRLLSAEIARAGLHAGHAYRQPQRRLRLRLARHRGNALAFGRDTRLPECDPSLPASAS